MGIKGSKEPLELFSVDLDYMALKVDEPWGAPLTWTSHQRYRSRQLLEADKRRIWQDHVCIADLFEGPDIEVMRRKYTEEFRHLFNMGYQNYSQGEWQVARQLLSRTGQVWHSCVLWRSRTNSRHQKAGRVSTTLV